MYIHIYTFLSIHIYLYSTTQDHITNLTTSTSRSLATTYVVATIS